MDKEINCWIAEYLLRHNAGKAPAATLLEKLDFRNDGDGRLRKTAALRDIWNDILEGTVSERVLDDLEALEKLVVEDGNADGDGSTILDSMKKAYCAVAVECTVRYLVGVSVKEGMYLDGVTRIWRERIKELERRESQLISFVGLKKMEDEIEAAVWDEDVRRRFTVSNTRNEALKLLSVYVAEQWALMGPPFLAKVSKTWEKRKEREGTGLESSHREEPADDDKYEDAHDDDSAIHLTNNERANGGEENVELDREKGLKASEVRIEIESSYELRSGSTSRRKKGAEGSSSTPEGPKLVKGKKAYNKKALPESKLVATRRRTRGAKIVANQESGAKPSSKIDCVPTPEYDKVREELKTSVLELQSLVTDPLPETMRLAKAVTAELAKRNENNETVVADKGNKGDADTSNNETVVVDKGNKGDADTSNNETVVVDKGNKGDTDASNNETVVVDKGNKGDADTSNNETVVADKGNKGDADTSNNETVVVDKGNKGDTDASNNETVVVDEGNKGDTDTSNGCENEIGECSQKGKSIQPEQNKNGNKCGAGPSNPKKRSLMERNDTAHTLEWQDSLDESSKSTSPHNLRPKLLDPTPISSSPLKLHQPEKFAIRRRRVKWTAEEEDALKQGVLKFGTGRWSAIFNTYRDVFSQRTEVDLKDKWRVMVGRGKSKKVKPNGE